MGRRLTAFAPPRVGSKLQVVEYAARFAGEGHILVVRVLPACKHGTQMDVEIPGGRW